MLGSACLWGEGQAPALGEPRVWRGEGGTASRREQPARLLAAPRTWRGWLRLAFHGVLSGDQSLQSGSPWSGRGCLAGSGSDVAVGAVNPPSPPRGTITNSRVPGVSLGVRRGPPSVHFHGGKAGSRPRDSACQAPSPPPTPQ